MIGVVLGSFVTVMGRMQSVGVRNVRVMSGLFMVAGVVMFRCLAMVASRVFVMLGGRMMVVAAFVLRAHVALLECPEEARRLP
jgi:hypothetical protein